jgi:hypothetical protein
MGGRNFNGGLGTNVARMCGGIIMTAGCELAPRDICPLGVILRSPMMMYRYERSDCQQDSSGEWI